MTKNSAAAEMDYTFLRLSKATRLLASETDLEKLVEIALITLSDFGRSTKVEFLAIEGDQNKATLLGLLENGIVEKKNKEIVIADTFMKQVVESKRPGSYQDQNGIERLFMPLTGSENTVDGLVILDQPDDIQLQELEMQGMIILTTLIAISYEQTKYYHLAMFDGLTGLFVRRQFDSRLYEEMIRVKRYGGAVSIFMADIDHFKIFNDSYGHLQGDIVLQELAGIMRRAVRKDVDVPCRFGGEEFVTIMPNTDIDGAFEVAERFRRNCEKFEFSGQDEPLKVTISGGVATYEQDSDLTIEQLLERADIKLYEAKESGRNKVLVWK